MEKQNIHGVCVGETESGGRASCSGCHRSTGWWFKKGKYQAGHRERMSRAENIHAAATGIKVRVKACSGGRIRGRRTGS